MQTSSLPAALGIVMTTTGITSNDKGCTMTYQCHQLLDLIHNITDIMHTMAAPATVSSRACLFFHSPNRSKYVEHMEHLHEVLGNIYHTLILTLLKVCCVLMNWFNLNLLVANLRAWPIENILLRSEFRQLFFTKCALPALWVCDT